MTLRILVVDDERISRQTTAEQLKDAGHLAEAASDGFQALQHLEEESWDVVLTDLRMPELDGLQLLKEIRRKWPEVEVILMTAYGTVETAVEAMREGASDFLGKPFTFAELEVRLEKLISVRTANHELKKLRSFLGSTGSNGGLVGRSRPMQEVFEQIGLLAASSTSILINGSSGTGKELVARAIHDGGRGRGSNKPFVAVPCGAIPEGLAESELLGHEKGSFTGALRRRRGSFEMADGGTLLLDDIDDLPLETQAKLVRVLEERRFRRVGGEAEIDFKARVISTTKIDLMDAIERGQFREDLFYRIRGHEIQLAPLRARESDVILLAEHFLRLWAIREHREVQLMLSSQVAERLVRHKWPGNVRELRSVIESAATLCMDKEIQLEHLPRYLHEVRNGDSFFSLQLTGVSRLDFRGLTSTFENELIRWALVTARGEQKEAARLLNLPRTTLQSKLAKRGVTPCFQDE